MNIKYISQHFIENPYGKRNFIVDFFIEINDIKYIIEYNGRQHYESVELFGGEKSFNEQVERDNNLKKYCEENKYNLLEIPYYKKENEIKDLIKKFILPSISESDRILEGKIGESCDGNTEVSSEIAKGSETP